jgi:hypothetical protein
MGTGGGDSRHDAGTAAAEKNAALVTALAETQNKDGGWPYRRGSSWTEPTVLALLALPPDHPACARGYAWLRGQQRPDGGWPPQAAVDQTTWVTSLVAFLPPAAVGARRHSQAVAWILSQTAANSTFWYRLRERLLGAHSSEEHPGWPWFPGTAAWVTPTSLAILALRKLEKAHPEIHQRIQQGRQFLLARTCSDGGWNHGSARALGYEGSSYPETTGVALLALAGVPKLEGSIHAAERHWRDCRSAEGAAWLKLGLLAHGHETAGWPAQAPPRNVRDTALCALAAQAEKGENAFLA